MPPLDPIIPDSRTEQRFPVLLPDEIARLRRFGELRAYPNGQLIFRAGETAPGLMVVTAGAIVVSQRDELDRRRPIVTHGVGAFLGELAQLTGRPALVDAHAEGDVEALVIAPDRLRALMVADAELGERIMRALILRRVGLLQTQGAGPIIIGRAGQADVLRLRGFLSRNGHPHQSLDPDEDAEARALVERFRIAPEALPIVLCPGGEMLRNPSEAELARCIGLLRSIDPERVYDVAIVGAGPAGLAAAVYAASEGLSVLTLDCRAFGGQAGASSRIENYLGFPTGITGMALMARAYNQAQKFGAEIAIPDEATGLVAEDGGLRLELANGELARARSVVLACGARYRRLAIADLESFEGTAIHYWASPIEGRLCADEEVVLVGGGNSAGQAVVFLARHARKVWLLIRGGGLEASMSRYLIDRIAALPNVELVTHAEITGLEGENGALSAVLWRDVRSGEPTRRAARQLFLFIGAEPNTDWLAGASLTRDARGFLLTGDGLKDGARPLETSLPGVFAIGDVRAGSVKRVAAAVGEGAQVVAAVHAYLAGLDAAAAPQSMA